MKVKTLQTGWLQTERLTLIPFTLAICRNILKNDFSDLYNLGLQKGKGWPDKEGMETLPKIINNLSKVKEPTGYESWMIIKNDSFEIIGDAGFKGFNSLEQNADIGYGIVIAERRKGYAEEAVKELLRWAFSNENTKEITAACLLNNVGSVNLLKKLHFEERSRSNEMIYWSLKRI